MILITGAATRIGAAIAKRLAARRNTMDPRFRGTDGVIIHYYASPKDAAGVAKEIEKQGTPAVLWQQDLRVPNLAHAFAQLVQQTGPIDTLVNNAAIFLPDQDKLGAITPEFFLAMMQVNCHAPFALMQAFAAQPIFLDKRFCGPDGEMWRGNIINILDQRVLNVSHAFPAYTASKSALWALTQNMARMLAPQIRVNAVAPGHVLPTQGEDVEKFKSRRAKTPLGNGPSPEEVAATVEFILNSQGMTGACIPLDGGEHLVPKTK